MAVGTRPEVLLPDELDRLPKAVYLAVKPENGGMGVEVRQWGRQPIALAYSTLDTFLQGCGVDQPWVLVPSEQLDAMLTPAANGAGVGGLGLLLDEPLPPEMWGSAGGMIADGADWTSEDSPDWAWVWVACEAYTDADEAVALDLQPMPGGHLAVMAYTSGAAVRAGAGPYQEAAPIPAGVLADVRHEAGADTICLDTPLPEQLRRGPDSRRGR